MYVCAPCVFLVLADPEEDHGVWLQIEHSCEDAGNSSESLERADSAESSLKSSGPLGFMGRLTKAQRTILWLHPDGYLN